MTPKRQFESWADITEAARAEARRDRDYRDHKQWTEQEAQALRARGQAPVVINRIAPKVDFMVGVERSTREDPKAWPRTPQHEDAANACTDALRYVAENAELDGTCSDCFEDFLVEGIEAVIVEWINGEIKPSRVPFDRIYYDPHAQDRFFKDASYKGVFIWMDVEEAVLVFGDKKKSEIERALITSGIDEGTEDKPRWADKQRKRIKVCQHYFLKKGVWHVIYFSGDIILVDEKESPYLDDQGEPSCPIEICYAYMDRDADKYGWVRQFIDIQDEINHRRSKALYLLSRRQVITEKGAVDDIYNAKRELAKGDGVIEVNPGMRFDVDPGNDLAAGQATLLQEAKSEIDSIAARSLISPDASGRSRLMADSKDMLEVGPLFDTHRIFKKRIYRQIWSRVRQFWDSERWVRVTDDEDNLKFVGLNQPVTVGELLKEKAEEGDELAAEALQRMVQAQDPRLNQQAEVRNQVAELDVDITIDEVQDSANVQQEQLEMLINLAQAYGPQNVPFKAVLSMTQLRNKRNIIDMIEGGEDGQDNMAQQIQLKQLELQILRQQAEIDKIAAETDNKRADTRLKLSTTEKTDQQAIQTAVETEVLSTQAVDSVSVNT